MSADNRLAEGGETPLPPDQVRKERPRNDLTGGLLLFLVSSVFLVQSLGMRFKDPSWEWYTSPAIFPTAMAGLLATLSLAVAARGALAWARTRATIAPLRIGRALREWGLVRFLEGAAAVIVFLFFLGKVNFYLLSAAMIVIFGTLFRSGSLLKALKGACTAAVFIVVFLYLLGRIFGIVFP